MAEISLETVTGKLNRIGHDAFFQALRQAKAARNSHVELVHWLHQVLLQQGTDLDLAVDHFKLDRARLSADTARAIEGLDRNQTQLAGVGKPLLYALDRGWHFATLLFGETQIRTGHVLVGVLMTEDLRPALLSISKEWGKIGLDTLTNEFGRILRVSIEEDLRPIDGSGLRGADTPGAAAAAGTQGNTALDRYSQDLTAKAATGSMDPIRGRDEEIRQVIDVLMRRRQNNPILTGEAGVGKTAVVEGFAQRIAAGDVPPPLRGVTLRALDIGLMQAGASMKGEFEQRLRSVIDEVQNSPTPIILFIDEAHTLIGAGGQAGTGDAANLLKPALARGTLRTIAATTWSEYRQHIEKDPALTRRFQPIGIDEPDAARCCDMLRGLLAPMEKHHGVRIADAAVVAAVHLSQRYIPARQLPDKAVSLLDTACARVAISQTTTPAALADLKVGISALETEKAALVADEELGTDATKRLDEIEAQLADLREDLAALQSEWASEQTLVGEIHALRADLKKPDVDQIETRAALKGKAADLSAIDPESRMIYPHVDEQSIAAVVSDWTGIPVGRMMKDEIETVLNLADILNRRVVGQSHGLAMIAKRIETNRARLDNPNKPIGVFMLCGPSGVGKTETALALAEALYGGEQNMITINMSEFQEAHSVSTLKGAPPGYIGYGEGGRLTEAVRRKPYSVILLDEVEKAHPDVHEIFFQVFDKGQMEDGTGRRIDFKNTLIILTSNVGTDRIMAAQQKGGAIDATELATALRPDLLSVFPPALIGRLVVIPYFPLSPDMLGGIVRLQLDRIGQRIADNQNTAFSYGQAVVDHIVSLCNDPDSGGRMIDNIITNTLLPDLSRGFLDRALQNEVPGRVRVSVEDSVFSYKWD
ncbi:type VI secretion system ATPase TssH [Lichenifustis flavocetrariae]|uniref:Type VI secretion system ATPase TssH n=1 Tax=Lichenifustis flavocetrariae TaxID=2949735 RepID=A0AA41YWB0_9HYPH|nr:type VI secretion system ATPase TssH [Lichenifustis flavocetrariae]MCW6509309.1 type VI secretion system ATPase TssH [Lichenifustis flavocetrariae]